MTATDHSAPQRPLHWVHIIVRVPLTPDLWGWASPRLADSLDIRQLKTIETWLYDNHVPQHLFDEFGIPRSDYVHAFFRSDKPAKALAFRVLCHELELSGSLEQTRVAINRCARTRPPLLDLADGAL